MLAFLFLFACGEKEEVLGIDTAETEQEIGSDVTENGNDSNDTEEESEVLEDDATEQSEEQNEGDTSTIEPETLVEEEESDTSGMGSANCSADDLIWIARVEDNSGNVVSPFSTGASLMFIGEVENTCDGEVILNTMTDCVVYSGTLYANSGLGTHLWTNACQVGATTWVFAPFETKSQTEVLGSRPVDHYELTIYFADASTQMAYASFDVE